MKKKRVAWNVHLVRSNLSPIKGQLTPKVRLNQSYSLEEVIERLTDGHGCGLSADTLRHAAGLLFDEMENCLIEGSAVHTPLGAFTPSVTGIWGVSNRLLPKVRQQNKAMVRYTMSPKLKKALANPLFHEMPQLSSRLVIASVRDFYSQTENERITPGQSISVKGNMLLMNGTSPRRGLYFVSEESGEEICHLQPESFVICTRSHIVALVPKDLPEGEYRLRVVSQCTTSPRPLKEPIAYTLKETLIVGDLQNQEESPTFATPSK